MQKTLKSYGSHVLWPDHCFRAYQMKTNAELLRLQTFLGEYSHDRSSRFVANYFTFIKPFMI